MERKIDGIIRCIAADVLGVEASLIAPGAGRGATPGWDTATHLDIVVAIESDFGLEFADSDIRSATTLAALVDLVMARLSA